MRLRYRPWKIRRFNRTDAFLKIRLTQFVNHDPFPQVTVIFGLGIIKGFDSYRLVPVAGARSYPRVRALETSARRGYDRT